MPVVDQSISEADGNVGERTAIHVARFDQCNQRIGVFDQITYATQPAVPVPTMAMS
jgi:hypothetical protein